MRQLGWLVLFLVTVQSLSLKVEELKRPGDPVRILVHFKRAPMIQAGSAVLEREGHPGECHLPQVVPLKGQIVCSTIEKIAETEYLFSGVVENNATGSYKLTRVVAHSNGREKDYVWGHDFDDIVRITVSNPQEKPCVK